MLSKIVEAKNSPTKETSLVEIGPRLVLTLVRIYEHSFGGRTLFKNPLYVSPNEVRKHNRQIDAVQGRSKRLKIIAPDAFEHNGKASLDMELDDITQI